MILYLNVQRDGPEQKSFNKADYLLFAARRLGLDWVKLYQNEPNPEYVLNIEPYTKFFTGSRWTGVWEIDLLCDRAQMTASNWAAADTVFIAGNTYSSRLQGWEHKVVTLFQACEPTIHRRIPTITQEFDFIQCGTSGLDIYKERTRLINLLRQKYSFKDWGKGFAPPQYVEKLNTARVQFIRSMKSTIADGEIAQRFFECLAIGPVITNYVDDLKDTGLVDGIDYFYYKSDLELMDKMEMLIKDSHFRQQMAENGRRKALLYHTYDHRLATIINFIQNHETARSNH